MKFHGQHERRKSMLDLFGRARWDQAYEYLLSGEPPIIFRLLALNTLVVILIIIRRARAAPRLRDSAVIQLQALLLGINCMVLFQNEVQQNAEWAWRQITSSF
jgi:hypothetical protein